MHAMADELQPGESPEEEAERLIEPLRGLLKEEFAQFGGAEGFLHWVRGYDDWEEAETRDPLPPAES